MRVMGRSHGTLPAAPAIGGAVGREMAGRRASSAALRTGSRGRLNLLQPELDLTRAFGPRGRRCQPLAVGSQSRVSVSGEATFQNLFPRMPFGANFRVADDPGLDGFRSTLRRYAGSIRRRLCADMGNAKVEPPFDVTYPRCQCSWGTAPGSAAGNILTDRST